MAARHDDTPPRTAPAFDWEGARERLERTAASIRAVTDPPPEQIRRILAERTAALAAPVAAGKPVETLDLVEFRLGERRYGFAAEHVGRVIAVDAVTALPGAPASYLGMVIHRGEVYPLIDLQGLIGGRRAPDWHPRRALLVADEAFAVAFAVDEIANWSRIDAGRLARAAEGSGRHAALLGLIDGTTELFDASLLARDVRLAINAKPA